MSYFTDLGLAEPIIRALETKGYADPTPIQRQAIPALLAGRDLLGIAQTGTGKTAAFSLPSLHRLAADPKPRMNASCRMLVMSPTRELAAQIAENMRGYAKYLNLSVQCIFGGVPVGKQARALVGGTDVLVATPGRLLDLIDQRALTLRNVEIFVLDEADQMMDLGFIVPLKRVANMLPKERQSLFFSATMPKAIADLGRQFINDPVRVEVAPQATTAERVDQFLTYVNQAEKQALLTMRLKDERVERALVFSRTKHGADRVVRHLVAAGVQAAAIHGNKSQAQRTAALQAFKTGATRVLVATDIAARGIDVTGVSHVFNYEMPNVPEQYVHRIGRTARAGADGVAVSFVAPDEKAYLRDIEKLTGVKLMPQPLPEDFAREAAKLPAPLKRNDEPTREYGGARSGRATQNRGSQGHGGKSHGGQGQGQGHHRGGQGRDSQNPGSSKSNYNPMGGHASPPKSERRDGRPQGERGVVANPARSEGGERSGESRGEQRRFTPRGPSGHGGGGNYNGGGGNSVGAHRGKVRRAS